MCGIVGYSGFQNAKDIVIDGLKTLEYRGYDSAGVALLNGEISLYKAVGSVSNLEKAIPQTSSHTAIGHTRWATHGAPDAKNAHPHLSFDGEVAVVHNGVIENCDALKKELSDLGIKFASDTDSEIIAHLIALALNGGDDMLAAIDTVGRRLDGAASFIAIRKGDPAIYMRRQGASLTIGLGDGEYFAASDPIAVSKYTQKFIALSDGECAKLHPEGATVLKDGKQINKRPFLINRRPPEPCACRMSAEIDEIPYAMARTLKAFEAFSSTADLNNFFNAQQIYLVGCGTAYHACLYGKTAIEEATKTPCFALPASEIDCATLADKDTAAIFITQSGETADTIYALDFFKGRGAKCLAITNAPQSSITFKADRTLLLDAGPEVAVAATKSYNCQLFALYLLCKRLKGENFGDEDFAMLSEAIKTASDLDLYDDKFKAANLFFVGKGGDYPTALEGALKFKEITYKMTDAYSAGELKHGPIALIDDNSVCIIICCRPADKRRLAATASELRARGAYTVAITAVGDIGADKQIELPPAERLIHPMTAIIPLQKLALRTSLALGYNPDRPRNLAKSVTVI